MSTVHETTVARHAGMDIFAMSLITNKVMSNNETEGNVNHEEVLQTAAERAEMLKSFVTKFIERL